MPRNEFIKQAQEEIKKQELAAEVYQKSVLHEADVIKNEGPKKWDALKQELKSTIEIINIEAKPPLSLTTTGNQLNIFGRPNRAVQVIFDTNTALINCSGALTLSFQARVVGNGVVYFVDINKYPNERIMLIAGKSPDYSIEEISERLIREAIGF